MLVTKNLTDVVATRRAQLRAWIDLHFDGSQTAFLADCASRGHEINQGELSGLMKKKAFGEKKARSLELIGRMSPGYLDNAPEDLDKDAPAPHRVAMSTSTYLVKPTKKQQWPFKSFGPTQYYQLDQSLRDEVEDRLLGAIVRHERANGTSG